MKFQRCYHDRARRAARARLALGSRVGHCYSTVTASAVTVVALSGGVDSATAAALLVEAGERVVGMTMRLYDAGGSVASSGGRCCGPRDIEDARAVCSHLGIPFYVVDLEADFTARVVDDFVEAYLQGETPNPCVRCNQYIKFTPLLSRARAIGADVLATGHYARLAPGPDGVMALHRGVDPGKDQSYFLFSMPGDELNSVRFPLGGMTKDEVRQHAARLSLPNAQKSESQEICFVPDGDYAGFVAAQALARRRPMPKAGAIVDARSGASTGRHDGTHHFTVGQHRGLGNLAIKGEPGAQGTSEKEKLFVVAVDPSRDEVRVGPKAMAQRHELTLRDMRWLARLPSFRADEPAGFEALIQVRHRQQPLAARVLWQNGSSPDLVAVVLDEPTVAAPGQAAVLYDGDRVLGGGWIAAAT
jgi:tRNA-uridine 2-sulfurtransferase